MAKPALGRGLGALLGGSSPTVHAAPAPPPAPPAAAPAAASPEGERVHRLPLKRVRPCPFQPRKEFSHESLQELAESIKEQGILQPLLVRPLGDHYELIAGERRWRAAQLLELAEVPAVIRQATDQEVLQMALIENLQRDNLNPLEEALGYAQLIDHFLWRQEDVAVRVGKSRAAVANALRLLKLPEEVQQYLRAGQVSVGHAKVILGLSQPEEQTHAAQRVLQQGLNVRQTEELVARWQQPAEPARAPAQTTEKEPRAMTEAYVADLENKFRERFGTKVRLHYRNGQGSLHIRFFSDDELDRLLQILGINAG